MSYYVKFAQRGTYRVDYRIASQSTNGILSLDVEGQSISTIFLPVTLGWQNWQTISNEVVMEEGEYFVKLTAVQGGFNLNWFSYDLITDLSEEVTTNSYELQQNYPNPFNPSTKIQYSVPNLSNVKIILYNTLGEEIRILIDQDHIPGNYIYNFEANNLSSGVYLYQIIADNFVNTKKMLLIK